MHLILIKMENYLLLILEKWFVQLVIAQDRTLRVHRKIIFTDLTIFILNLDMMLNIQLLEFVKERFKVSNKLRS